MELGADFFSDLVAATVYAGSNGSVNIPRPSSKIPLQLSNTLLNDSLYRAAPSCMEYTYRMLPLVNEDHGNAVSRLYCEKQMGSCRDQAVSDEMMLGN